MSATTCPGCGKRVSPYAAGCEECGADLDEHRRRLHALPGGAPAAKQKRRRVKLPESDFTPMTRGELLWGVLTIFFVPFVHLLALLLAGLGAYDRWHAGRQTAFTAYVLLGVVALALEVADLL